MVELGIFENSLSQKNILPLYLKNFKEITTKRILNNYFIFNFERSMKTIFWKISYL
jgi:hypothetical protein